MKNKARVMTSILLAIIITLSACSGIEKIEMLSGNYFAFEKYYNQGEVRGDEKPTKMVICMMKQYQQWSFTSS